MLRNVCNGTKLISDHKEKMENTRTLKNEMYKGNNSKRVNS